MNEPLSAADVKEFVAQAILRRKRRRHARAARLMREWTNEDHHTHRPVTVISPEVEGDNGRLLDEMAEARCDDCHVLLGLPA